MNLNSILYKSLFICLFISLFAACKSDLTPKVKSENFSQFTALPVTKSKIAFKNSIKESINFNFVNYLNMYNGGGVAMGDINNDGLLDVYLTANQTSNKLYLNQGDMEFEDITKTSGTADKEGWTAGTTMIDINNDGWLDIYVCKSASMNNPEWRENKLYINQKDNTFKDLASNYGLDIDDYSVQSYFFDYDKDGDLDMYLVNHRTDFNNTIVMSKAIQANIIPDFSDKLYRNDGLLFTDVTAEAGITNKTWGHSASINDYNQDGWLDLYVSNDFLEPDHLWINDQKGGFKDEILSTFDHISYYSMGSDVADINNDGMEDLIVLDMASEDHVRSKQNMAGMSTERFHTMVSFGYHQQYMTNMLQLNNGNGAFSEIGHMAGVSNTDWSWAPVFADFDNDGYRDLFITNGIKRDMTDNDYKKQLDELILAKQGNLTLDEVFEMAPSTKLTNYMYRNTGHSTFEKVSDEWGLGQKLNSNGVAYGDLDNDGDLDLIVNNLEDYASVYQNNSVNNYLRVELKGSETNINGIGARIEISSGGDSQYYNHFLNRGFQSTMGNVCVFGLDDHVAIESVKIIWPNGKLQILENIKANKTLTLDYVDATESITESSSDNSYFTEIDLHSANLDYTHIENEYNDFATEVLLPYKYSSLGPNIGSGDVNGDGLTDFYLGGAQDMTASLFLQNSDNSFTKTNQSVWAKDKFFEDVNAIFFDADGDGDEDLYVVSGGNELSRKPKDYEDRLYINDGTGSFSKSSNALPKIQSSGSAVLAEDIDADGDLDLFVGGRVIPGQYPIPASSFLLENNNGVFKDVTASKAAELLELGLLTDAIFSDYDKDGDRDLMIVGEWMPLTIFKNDGGVFSKTEHTELTGTGWWYSINAADVDNDGDEDYVLGNLGLNNKFKAKRDKPFHVFANDFDGSGNIDIVLGKESKGKLLPVRGRECSSQQMPFIKEKFPTFKSFAVADLDDIYGESELENALHLQVNNFETAILLNNGDGHFEYKKLPYEAQYGPSLETIIEDVNKDGHLDIVGAGNIYDTEVETVRFDASKGYVLLGDGKGSFVADPDAGFKLHGDVKDLALFSRANKSHILVAKNNGSLQLFQIDN